MKFKGWHLIILMIILLGSGLMLFFVSSRRGAASPQGIVHEYLSSLSGRNERRMERLVSDDYDAKDAIRRVLDEKGGHSLENITVGYEYPNSESSAFVLAKVDAQYHDGPKIRDFHDEIPVSNPGGNTWYLMIGRVKNVVNMQASSTTQ